MPANVFPLKDTEILPQGGIEKLALVILDVQREYCDSTLRRGTAETEAVAARINTLTAAFRKAGLPVFVVHTTPVVSIGKHEGAPHIFQPASGDIITEKSGNSAVASGTLLQRLQEKGVEKVLLCGFNLSACIRETTLDLAMWDMKVTLLRDLCGNDKPNTEICKKQGGVAPDIREMAIYGAKFSTSTKALSCLRR